MSPREPWRLPWNPYVLFGHDSEVISHCPLSCRPGFVPQGGRIFIRSAHRGAGRRVSDGGDPKGAGHLLTQGHLHPASSPGVNLMPARPLVDGARPPLFLAWVSDSEPTEGTGWKVGGLTLWTQRQVAPPGSGLSIIYSSSVSLFSLQYRPRPSALGRPPPLSQGSGSMKGGDFRMPLPTCPCRGDPRIPRTASAKHQRRRVTTLPPAIIWLTLNVKDKKIPCITVLCKNKED